MARFVKRRELAAVMDIAREKNRQKENIMTHPYQSLAHSTRSMIFMISLLIGVSLIGAVASAFDRTAAMTLLTATSSDAVARA